MNRKPLIAGNWKMHCTVSEAVTLATAVAKSSQGLTDREVMIAPPFTALYAVVDAVKDSPVQVGAQNIAWEKQGAYTGEISSPMLNDLGVAMAIIGHSERRHIFFENNEMVNQRLAGALAGGVIPVLCVGETLDEREEGATFNILENQIREALAGVAAHQVGQLVVAYEPVWAIGTGKTATTAQAQEAHSFIRGRLAGLYEKNLAEQIRILYGGSVKPENVDNLMAQPDIDGALVGGAALNSESFDRIIHFS